MAKVKGFDPPETEFAYEDADGELHYFGAFFRMIFGEGTVSPWDPATDIIGKSRRGERPTQQGEGSEGQKAQRKAFLDCVKVWNALPEECPEVPTEPPTTSKKSVWDAKVEHGVTCSYYDLFMRCCVLWAAWHVGEMPDGDCFPCIVECTEDPAMAWDEETSGETVAREGSVTVAITGINTPFSWSVSGTGFSLEDETTIGLTNTLYADDTACGGAIITVTGCDDREVKGYVKCTTGAWVTDGSIAATQGFSDCLKIDGTGCCSRYGCSGSTYTNTYVYLTPGHRRLMTAGTKFCCMDEESGAWPTVCGGLCSGTVITWNDGMTSDMCWALQPCDCYAYPYKCHSKEIFYQRWGCA